MSISSITSSLLNLYSYSSLSQSSSTTSSSLTSTDSSTISEQAQSLLDSNSETTDDSSVDSSSSGVSTYYQMGSFGRVIEKYANKTLASLSSDESSEDVEETDNSSEEKGTAYSWNFAISTAGQHSITSGLIGLFKSSSGEEREALKEQILTGLSTEGSAYLSYLSSQQSSGASDSWTQSSNLMNGVSDRDSSLIQVNLDNLDDVDLTSAQREQLNNLQLQVAVVNSYTQLSNSISSINLFG